MTTLLELPRTPAGQIDLRQFHLNQAANYRETAESYKKQLRECDPEKDPGRWDYIARKVNYNEIQAANEEALAQLAAA